MSAIFDFGVSGHKLVISSIRYNYISTYLFSHTLTAKHFSFIISQLVSSLCCLISLDVLDPGAFALLNINASQEGVLIEQLSHFHSFSGVALQAALHELLKLGRPFPSDLRHVNIDDVVDELPPVSDVGEGRIAGRQLICEASIRPYVYFLGVGNACSNLW